MKEMELLAPAGTKEAFLAAISAGANAIYFGLQDFNARQRAKNIKNDELAKLIKIAHKNNVRAYLTLNVLVYSSEFKKAHELVDFAISCGIDAVIVQDLGMIQYLRTNFPKLELHASTQLTTHNLEQCKFLADLGIKQVNLCRELSLQEIKPLCEYLNSRNVATEVFVHGAFCVSFSGQCYFSGGLYGLKGNRGECVQPCRRAYKSQNQTCTPFNLKDNCLFQNIDELYKIGVKSLKIEGRIKSPEYVWAVTSAYREQIDNVYKNLPLKESDFRLSSSMNRMFTNNYLLGDISKSMFTYGPKDHSLDLVGFVESYYADKKMLTLSAVNSTQKSQFVQKDNLTILEKNGDFVCTAEVIGEATFANAKTQIPIQITGKMTKHIQKGNQVYKNPSIISESELKKLYSKLENLDEPLTITAKGKEGTPLELVFALGDFKVSVKSSNFLAKSEKSGLTREVLFEKLGRLGNTGFYLQNLNVESLQSDLFLPLSELNALRRTAVDLLNDNIRHCEKIFCKSVENNRHCEEQLVSTQQSCKENSCQTEKVFVFQNIQKATDFLQNQADTQKLCPIVLELPLLPTKEYLQFFEQFPFVIPQFQAILFEEHFVANCDFLCEVKTKLAHNFVMVENLGFAKFAFENGFCLIPGFQLNIFNNEAISFFSNFWGANAVVVSSELSKNELHELQNPKGTEIWIPGHNAELLMQSRQCLLCNIPSDVNASPKVAYLQKNGQNIKATVCTKGFTDESCLQKCDKTIELVGLQNEHIFAIKKPGFYSRLYKMVQISDQSLCDCTTNQPFPSANIVRKLIYVI